jgi:hypothetical protein
MARPHTASFNYMLEQGLACAVSLLDPVVIDADEAKEKQRVKRTFLLCLATPHVFESHSIHYCSNRLRTQ